jgi:ChrR Cupin-like domain
MSQRQERHGCDRTERVALHAIQALPRDESEALRSHIDSCPDCRHELEVLRPVVESFASWPTDVLRPSKSLWDRLARRVAAESGTVPLPAAGTPEHSVSEWEEVGPGISCKLLATDEERHRVSMLVRLAPAAEYPPHTHAGTEELHLLAGELWIDNRLLHPGDYNRAEPGTRDVRVWSETGCTCVLITSYRDTLS